MSIGRKIARVIAVVGVIGSLLGISATQVYAGSYGSCGTSGSGEYHSGEGVTAVRNGIYASMQVNDVSGVSVFHPCYPSDGSGKNASSVNIGFSYGSAWLEAGVIDCNHTDLSWPSGMCNSTPQVFVEQHGQAPWDYNLWDIGLTNYAAHSYEIVYNSSTGDYDFYYDGSRKLSVNMGSGLVPGQNNGYYWQLETQDVGDGLGTSTYAANIGQMELKQGSTWYYHGAGSSCDTISSQHHCVINGSYGFYGYTVN